MNRDSELAAAMQADEGTSEDETVLFFLYFDNLAAERIGIV